MQNKNSSALAASGILNEFFLRKKKDSPRFSLRSLARTLQVSPSFLSEVFKGKKALPPRHLDKLIALLEIDIGSAMKIKRTYLKFSDIVLDSRKVQTKKLRETEWKLVQKSQREVLRNWYFLPMLELLTTDNFDGDFSSRLGISKAAAEYGVKRLIELGLVKKDAGSGQLTKVSSHLSFLSNTTEDDFRSFHKQILDRAKDELSNASESAYQRRLISGSVISVKSERISELKTRLDKLVDEFSEECTSETGDEIYSLSVQFFPLSKSKSRNSKT